jgi:hypothetical protein
MSDRGTAPDQSGSPPRRRRLDEMAGPGWVGTMATLFRGAGIGVALLLVAIGFFTGSFFLVLTLVLAAIALVVGFMLARLVERESWWDRPNSRNYSLILLAAFPLVMVLFAQLAGPALTPAPVTGECLEGEVERDEQRDVRLPVDPRITAMQFRIHVPALDDGALRWWVTDPVGEIPWGGRADEAGFTEVAEPGPMGGQWTVTIRGEASRAEYVIEWRGATAGTALEGPSPCD